MKIKRLEKLEHTFCDDIKITPECYSFCNMINFQDGMDALLPYLLSPPRQKRCYVIILFVGTGGVHRDEISWNV